MWQLGTKLTLALLVSTSPMALAAPPTPIVTDTTLSAPITGDNGISPSADDNDGNTGEAAIAFGSNTITITNNTTLTGGNGGDAGSAISGFDLTGGTGGDAVSFGGQDGTSTTLRPVFINNIGGIVRGGIGGIGTDGSSGTFAGIGDFASGQLWTCR